MSLIDKHRHCPSLSQLVSNVYKGRCRDKGMTGTGQQRATATCQAMMVWDGHVPQTKPISSSGLPGGLTGLRMSHTDSCDLHQQRSRKAKPAKENSARGAIQR